MNMRKAREKDSWRNTNFIVNQDDNDEAGVLQYLWAWMIEKWIPYWIVRTAMIALRIILRAVLALQLRFEIA